MYYLIKREELPDFFKDKFFEKTKDGRIVIDDFTLKMCDHISSMEMVKTYRDLKTFLNDEGKEHPIETRPETKSKEDK